jgi:hypothetical protein
MSSEFDLVAERTLILVEAASGARREIKIQIGKPYWTEAGVEAACPVAILGLLERRDDIRGVDLVNAIESALKFVQQYLSGREPDVQVCWADGEPYFD